MLNAVNVGMTMSEHFNNTQNEVSTVYSDNYGNYYEAWINQTFYINGTQTVGYISDGTSMEFFDKLIIYFNLVLSIFGGIGHVLSLVILLRPPFNEAPHSVFCSGLALVDLIFMLRQIGISILRILIGKPAILINGSLCKIVVSFTFLFSQLDSWILTGLSGERLIAVFWPLRAKLIIKKSRIKIFLVILVIFLTSFHGESMIRYGLVEIRKGEGFVQNCQSVYFYGLPQKIFMVKDRLLVFLLSAIPFLTISSFNVAILIRLAKRRNERAQLGANTNTSRDNKTNGMLLAIMLVYIFLNFPVYVYVVVVNALASDLNDVILRFFILISTISVALNFYLYSLTSAEFREAVVDLFKCKRNVAGQPSGVPGQRGRVVRARPAQQEPVRSRDVQIPLKRVRY